MSTPRRNSPETKHEEERDDITSPMRDMIRKALQDNKHEVEEAARLQELDQDMHDLDVARIRSQKSKAEESARRGYTKPYRRPRPVQNRILKQQLDPMTELEKQATQAETAIHPAVEGRRLIMTNVEEDKEEVDLAREFMQGKNPRRVNPKRYRSKRHMLHPSNVPRESEEEVFLAEQREKAQQLEDQSRSFRHKHRHRSQGSGGAAKAKHCAAF